MNYLSVDITLRVGSPQGPQASWRGSDIALEPGEARAAFNRIAAAIDKEIGLSLEADELRL